MQEKLEAFLNYINEDVLHHFGSLDSLAHAQWLKDLGHDILAIFHFDATMVILIAVILLLIGICGRRTIGRIPHGLGVLLEKYVLFIRDEIVYPNFGGATLGRGWVSFFCTLFLFILFSNVMGLIPLFTCATGNVNVTGALAVIFIASALFGTVRAGGFHGILKALVPGGLPVAMRPLMFLMECVSLCTRTFALAVRLFANMLGGHIVLYAMISLTAIFGLAATPSLAIAVCLYFFEVFVACLQAYVFTMLTAIFIGMMVHPQH